MRTLGSATGAICTPQGAKSTRERPPCGHIAVVALIGISATTGYPVVAIGYLTATTDLEAQGGLLPGCSMGLRLTGAPRLRHGGGGQGCARQADPRRVDPMNVTPEAVTLSVPELRALMAHASTDETRPHLNGVAVDAARSRCFATDGQRCLVVQGLSDRVGPAVEPLVVPLATLDVARRAVKADGHITIRRYAVAATGERALAASPLHVGVEVHDRFGNLVTAIHVKCNEGAPPLDAVMPQLNATEGPRCPVTGMATSFLAALATVSAAAGTKGVEIWPPVAPDAPWAFTAAAADGTAHWTAVIMPMRMDTDVKPASRPASETAAAAALPPVQVQKGKRGRKAA